MTYIPSCYYAKPILKLLDSLIDEGYQSYVSLSEADQDRVIALCMDALGDDAYSCLDLEETTSHLQKYILSFKPEDAVRLANKMRGKALSYFKDVMIQLFDERKAIYNSAVNFEHGFVSSMNRNSGESEWRRIA